MNYTYEMKNGCLEVKLLGEIDHHGAKQIRKEIDELITADKPSILYLELSEIAFCDSSGLGLVMGRMKAMSGIGGRLVVLNPSPAVKKILEVSGMDRIIKIEYKGGIKL